MINVISIKGGTIVDDPGTSMGGGADNKLGISVDGGTVDELYSRVWDQRVLSHLYEESVQLDPRLYRVKIPHP